MTESILGVEQAVDEKWIEQLASKLSPGKDSGKQLLNVIKEIYFSNANREPNRDVNVCYDRVAANTQLDFAPCKITSILNRKCRSCHSDNSASLDLTTIQKFNSERSWFVHTGQKTIADSASEILTRLN